jgi:putative tricarboxylic transport membrane protein
MNTGPGRCIRAFVVVLASAAALISTAVEAQTYPSKPIEFIVHTAPGGGTDLFARGVSEFMAREKIFSQPLVVANKPGGSGATAFNYVKNKRGDAHVVLTMATGSCV